VEGALDGFGNVVPSAAHLLDGLDVVVDVLEVDPGEVRAPVGHRAFAEVVERLEPELQHPLGLALVLRDGGDDLGR
jgi:hypothetical protein